MKIGRNDPCHCGSGLKYKKCHAAKDDAAFSAELAAQAAERAAAKAAAVEAEEASGAAPVAKGASAKAVPARPDMSTQPRSKRSAVAAPAIFRKRSV